MGENVIMDYEYYYNNAKSRYYNACSEINDCDNRINDLNRQKWRKLNEINQINSQIRNVEQALSGIEQMVKKDAGLSQSFLKISNTTNEAANNYMRMISSDNISNKNLNDVYRNETNNTKKILDGIFDTLRSKKNALNARITELKSELQKANNEYQSFDSSIRATEANRQDWRTVKRSAAYDMEYYRRKMQEVAW